MSWSYRVARIAGIDIKIHATFLLIVAFFALQWGSVHGVTGALFGTLLIIALFACVTLHELGHSLAAQAFDIPVREIVLLPLGGVAVLGRNARKPVHELIIALAGPVVNVVIAGVLLVVLAATSGLTMLDMGSMVQGLAAPPSLETLLLWLLEANIMLVLFNMLPAFPLDGGRVLRAALAIRLGQRRATRIAGSVGQTIAIILGVVGLFSLNFFLTLIAVFIFFGAGQEQVEERATTILSTRRVGDAYNKHVLTLAIGDRVSKVIDYVLTSYQPDFAVLQGSRLIGIVTRDDVLRALADGAQSAYVPDVYITTIMRRDVVRVDASTSLDAVRQVMSEKHVRVVAVFEGETYLGLINIDDIAEAFTVLTFTERYQRQPPPPGSVIPSETSVH